MALFESATPSYHSPQHGANVHLSHEQVETRVRRMIAVQLNVAEQALNDEFRWLDEMGYEDAEYFLAEINDAFTTFPTGFSLGDGNRPFRGIDAESLEKIATVGGLIRRIEAHLSTVQS